MAKSDSRRGPPRKQEKQSQTQPKPWTVMLYMAASRDEQTEAAAIRDLKELEKIGTTRTCNVIVQIDRRWPGYSERYCVRKGVSEFRDTFPPAADLRKFFKENDPEELGEFYTKYPEELCKLLGAKDAKRIEEVFWRQRSGRSAQGLQHRKSHSLP